MSGKVRGTVTVGGTPMDLGDVDLHAYIVVGDGRAYTAISEVAPANGIFTIKALSVDVHVMWQKRPERDARRGQIR